MRFAFKKIGRKKKTKEKQCKEKTHKYWDLQGKKGECQRWWNEKNDIKKRGKRENTEQ